MSKNAFIKNYGQTILLLLGVATGAVCGAVFGAGASIVKPIGQLFLNLLFVLVVPLVFFSIASSICTMTAEKKVGKVLGWSLVVYLVMSIAAAFITWLLCEFWNPLGEFATKIPPARSGIAGLAAAGVSTGQALVDMFTVDDFPKLLNRTNLLPLIVFSILFGISTSFAGEKGRQMKAFIHSGMDVVMEFINVIMYAAPLCLGCYFADMVGKLGGNLVGSYVNSLMIFLVLTVVVFFGLNTVYIALACGRDGLYSFWKNIPQPALVAISTCSSAASIPACIDSAKKMGVSDVISESVIPLGINLHKEGSVINGALRVVFIVAFFGLSGYGCLECVGIAILTSLVVGAIPTGGMTGEILACSILGVDPGFAATLLVISTLVDIPATLLNTAENVVAAVWVDRLCRTDD